MTKPPESTADMVRKRFNLGLDKADEDWIIAQIEEHVAEAVGREREACAALCDSRPDVYNIAFCLASDIRDRGEA